jgi:ketosteroid isomerase-like protein
VSEPERNFELVRNAFEAFAADPGQTLFIHPEVECYVSPRLMNAGTWHGIDGYREMVKSWGEAWADLRFEVVELDAPDDRHVLATMRQTAAGRESGVPVEMNVVFLFEIEGGRARRLHIYTDRESAEAAI